MLLLLLLPMLLLAGVFWSLMSRNRKAGARDGASGPGALRQGRSAAATLLHVRCSCMAPCICSQPASLSALPLDAVCPYLALHRSHDLN